MVARAHVTDDGWFGGVFDPSGDHARADELHGDLIGILEAVALPIIVVGPDFKVDCFNRAATIALGLTPAHVGRPPSDNGLLAEFKDLEKHCARVIADGVSSRCEVAHEGRWFLLRVAPYTGRGEESAGVVLTLTNVTAFRASIDQAIYEREYTKAIFNTVSGPIVIVDADLRVQTANRAFYEMFQVSRDETQGVRLNELRNHKWDGPQLWALVKDAVSATAEFQPVEVEHDFALIGRRTLLLDARPLSREGHSEHLILLTFQDISDRKQAEAQLRRNEQTLKEADRKKDQFLAILAHELRNPLGPVRNAAHYLKLKEIPDPELKRPVEMIERQVEHMARLIDDLLDVSRISRGVLELRRERLDFEEVVKAAVDACHDEIDARHHALRVSLPKAPVTLHADRHRLIQVFCNLISNASKYTPVGGRIDFTAQQNGDTLDVWVKDNGAGIPREKLSEIFELFAQVDRSLDHQGGLGIGLTLSRELVELHGGTIDARSEGLGHGSTIAVKLPIAHAAPATVPTAITEPQTGAKVRRIVIADDNEDAAESLAQYLELDGHRVSLAYDGEAALKMIAESLPEVAFVDIGMPKVNGYDVARRIRESAWGKSIHLVALTGFGQDSDRQLASEAGFNTHLVKPVSPDRITEILAELGNSSKDKLPL